MNRIIPLPYRNPYPWWMLVTLVNPETIVKYGKKALNKLHEARDSAKELGKEHRQSYDNWRRKNG
jgi:hypothetical protein